MTSIKKIGDRFYFRGVPATEKWSDLLRSHGCKWDRSRKAFFTHDPTVREVMKRELEANAGTEESIASLHDRDICTWTRHPMGTWHVTGPLELLKLGIVWVQARFKEPKIVHIENVRREGSRWIASPVPQRMKTRRKVIRETVPDPQKYLGTEVDGQHVLGVDVYPDRIVLSLA